MRAQSYRNSRPLPKAALGKIQNLTNGERKFSRWMENSLDHLRLRAVQHWLSAEPGALEGPPPGKELNL